MKLYLMRHGQANSPNIDPEQGLSPVGRAEIAQLAERLVERHIDIVKIFHSEKTRARQTAEIMASHLAPDVAPELRTGLKPNDDPAPMLAEIARWQADTLLVSHLPFVPSLLSLLLGEPLVMPFVTGTLVCLQRVDNGWQLEWVESP